MSWTLPELHHNISILYNHLCSERTERVYVDRRGHLQVDNRRWLARQLFPLGDSSRRATDEVALRTLRRVVRALENGELDREHIVRQERSPIGLLLDHENGEWLNNTKFGMNVNNTARFNTWMPGGNLEESQLSHEQRLCIRVRVLTQMILYGKEEYIEGSNDPDHCRQICDQSDNET